MEHPIKGIGFKGEFKGMVSTTGPMEGSMKESG